MVGTATLTEPIITALVSDPRIIDRLMAQRAEGVTTSGVAETLAAPAEAACLSGGCGEEATSCSFMYQSILYAITCWAPRLLLGTHYAAPRHLKQDTRW